ncbi:Single-stranded DNA-binding protein, partial [human gut metagenome]
NTKEKGGLSMNNVSLIGRLVSDPELKYVNDDRALCKFCLAVSRDYRNKDGVIPTDFINIDIWGRKAEVLCQYASKGSLIAVEGSLRIDKYVNKDGQNRTKAIINADSFHFLGHKHRD